MSNVTPISPNTHRIETRVSMKWEEDGVLISSYGCRLSEGVMDITDVHQRLQQDSIKFSDENRSLRWTEPYSGLIIIMRLIPIA